MDKKDSLIGYVSQSIIDNWEHPALSDFNGVAYQYKDVARKIAKLHILFEHAGVKPGDHIAICGKNSSQWAVVLLGAITYGVVAVPLLHEFKADQIHNLVSHSGSKLLFTDESIWENLDPTQMPQLEGALLLQDYSLLMSHSKELSHIRATLNEAFGRRYPERFTRADVSYDDFAPDTLALINYTSGSTGSPKGVMLSYDNLWSNVQFCIDGLTFLNPGDPTVCMLPMAHMFGLTVDLLHPFVKGCHIHFLTRTPSPKVIMDAFAEVRPKMIVSVPLVIEKIIKTRVFPLLEKPMMKILLHVPFVDDKLMDKIRQRIESVFGGNLQELIIGGAGLSPDVETFLRRIRFPFTVGYGMTECGPLIAYTPWQRFVPGSCGAVVDRMEARVDSPEPATRPGTIFVRGRNVMQGYYHNPEATAAVIAPDGWMDTGDIGTLQPDGTLAIRGRDKTMILGPSGQNIYPEEIEHQLNNMPYVGESLVVDRSGRIVALVYPDVENARAQGIDDAQLQTIMQDNLSRLNDTLPSYSRVAELNIMPEEFEKTPKRSIKRYLYK